MKVSKKTKLWEWQQIKQGQCEKCGKMRDDLTVEHIIPVNLLLSLGLRERAMDDEENFAHYCRGCNYFKGGRLDMAHPKTLILLKKYINNLN